MGITKIELNNCVSCFREKLISYIRKMWCNNLNYQDTQETSHTMLFEVFQKVSKVSDRKQFLEDAKKKGVFEESFLNFMNQCLCIEELRDQYKTKLRKVRRTKTIRKVVTDSDTD